MPGACGAPKAGGGEVNGRQTGGHRTPLSPAGDKQRGGRMGEGERIKQICGGRKESLG